MSMYRGFDAGEERLGRVLRDAVEGRGRSVTASLAGAGIGRRAFVAAVERAPEEPLPSGERPRFGAIAAAAVIGALVAVAFGLVPAITAPRPRAVHAAPVAAQQRPAPAAMEHRAARQVVSGRPAAAEPAPTSVPAPPSTGAS
jgi:hypothetical protein